MARVIRWIRQFAVAAIACAALLGCDGDGGTVSPASGTTVTGVAVAGSPSSASLNSVIAVFFSQALDPGSLSASSLTLAVDGAPVAGTVITRSNTVVFVPDAQLLAGKVYRMTVTGIRGVSGTTVAPFSSDFTTGTTPDSVLPAILETSPVAGSTGPAPASVVLRFSESLNPVTATTDAVVLTGPEGPISGNVTVNGATITFTPLAPLTSGRTFTVTVAGSLEDMAKNRLQAPFAFNFTTAASPVTSPPRIIVTLPTTDAVGVATTTAVSATFSEPMDPATITTGTFTVSAPTGPVPGTVALNGNVAVFSPLVPLLPSTRYTATVSAGARDTSGTPLPANFVWGFTTAGSSPAVASVLPAANSSDVAVNIIPSITFSTPMDQASFTTDTFSLSGPLGPVLGAVTVNGAAATFTPLSPLSPGITYTANVTGVRDLAGRAIAAPFSWSFTTGNGTGATRPVVVSVAPSNGSTSVPVTSPDITATFSSPMDSATITPASFTLSAFGIPVQGNVSVSGTTARFSLLGPLQNRTTYTAVISTGVRDLAGQSLAAPFSWSFTTQ